ncbi:hypothetical protein CYMTET_40922 [Cymbomonas tetramitiformis]|uniref:Uncharacterized protein n=1 Tax=Cymbomonas tetramitiformis TaxID=36881 RepID=A0AAE0C990_9CHLO|nr:hypothetical protein CYMTET_40922 [Cymbomonas tetramitiformis]|eukprot:gene221-397_t
MSPSGKRKYRSYRERCLIPSDDEEEGEEEAPSADTQATQATEDAGNDFYSKLFTAFGRSQNRQCMTVNPCELEHDGAMITMCTHRDYDRCSNAAGLMSYFFLHTIDLRHRIGKLLPHAPASVQSFFMNASDTTVSDEDFVARLAERFHPLLEAIGVTARQMFLGMQCNEDAVCRDAYERDVRARLFVTLMTEIFKHRAVARKTYKRLLAQSKRPDEKQASRKRGAGTRRRKNVVDDDDDDNDDDAASGNIQAYVRYTRRLNSCHHAHFVKEDAAHVRGLKSRGLVNGCSIESSAGLFEHTMHAARSNRNRRLITRVSVVGLKYVLHGAPTAPRKRRRQHPKTVEISASHVAVAVYCALLRKTGEDPENWSLPCLLGLRTLRVHILMYHYKRVNHKLNQQFKFGEVSTENLGGIRGTFYAFDLQCQDEFAQVVLKIVYAHRLQPSKLLDVSGVQGFASECFWQNETPKLDMYCDDASDGRTECSDTDAEDAGDDESSDEAKLRLELRSDPSDHSTRICGARRKEATGNSNTRTRYWNEVYKNREMLDKLIMKQQRANDNKAHKIRFCVHDVVLLLQEEKLRTRMMRVLETLPMLQQHTDLCEIVWPSTARMRACFEERDLQIPLVRDALLSAKHINAAWREVLQRITDDDPDHFVLWTFAMFYDFMRSTDYRERPPRKQKRKRAVGVDSARVKPRRNNEFNRVCCTDVDMIRVADGEQVENTFWARCTDQAVLRALESGDIR